LNTVARQYARLSGQLFSRRAKSSPLVLSDSLESLALCCQAGADYLFGVSGAEIDETGLIVLESSSKLLEEDLSGERFGCIW